MSEARLVLQAARRHVWVARDDRDEEGERLRVKGGVRLIPGDRVVVDDDGAVSERLERSSLLRRRTHRGDKELAANVDDLAVVVAAKMRDGGEGLVARCIAAAGSQGIHALILANKVDLDDDGALAQRVAVWREAGHEALLLSAVVGTGLDAVRERLAGRTVALVGASGVGKSAIINALRPGVAQRVAEVDAHGRGRHTTTLGRAIRWRDGLLIDLPGVKTFGLVDDRGLDAAFPDLTALAKGCRFSDCGHAPEPGCAVREAIENGELSEERLDAYRAIVESIERGEEGSER